MALEDAELLLGMRRHLSAYAASPSVSALGEIEISGMIYEMAWRMRGSSVSSAARVIAIGTEAKIRRTDLLNVVLPALETMNWITTNKDWEGTLQSVEESVPPPGELIMAAGRVIALSMPSPVEMAALQLMRVTSIQPLERRAALEIASEYGDEAAEEALRHLIAVNLVREVTASDGRSAVFNPNIWIGDDEVVKAALRTEDAACREQIGALLEEVSGSPGMPELDVKSTEQRWIDFAVANGLVQRSVVKTSENDEKRFLFSPHLGRDPFGVKPGDVSGHVRQMVGSMIYASTYPQIKLRMPDVFVRKLIQEGEAGDASPIGTDYPMLETAGIVRVVPGSRAGRFRFELLQTDVAEQALEVLTARSVGGSQSRSGSEARNLSLQQSYSHLETERARLASYATSEDVDLNNLVAALRETTAKRAIRG